MNLLSDVLTYIRRLLKAYTNGEISDNLLIDYVNRFYINDVDADIQLFDLKKKYEFQTIAGVDKYNMPLYDVQSVSANQDVNFYPVYQGFEGNVYVNGYQIPLYLDRSLFRRIFPDYDQELQSLATGDGATTNFDLTFPVLGNNSTPVNPPVNAILRGHVDISGIIATAQNVDPPLGTTLNLNIPTTSIDSQVWITSTDAQNKNLVVADSGQMLTSNTNYGLLMDVGNAPYGNTVLAGGYSTTLNTVDYLNGTANVTFSAAPADGATINAKVKYFQTGRPRGVLFYNNTLTLRQPPDRPYTIELEGYMSPSAFLATTNAIPFGYMSEYIARGAARKIMSDTGDMEQMQFYEPLYQEQKRLVHRRSLRQKTATRNQTIYSMGNGYNNSYPYYGGFQ